VSTPHPSGSISDPKSGDNRYRGPDRRKQPTPAFSRYTFFGGRRYYHRRTEERAGTYVDLYSRNLVFFLLIFFTLTVIDSVSTLIYLDKGGREFNPLAQWMIDQGDNFFILCKGGLTALCILFIMIHKNFKYSRFAIFTGFSFYFLLTIYHIVLQIKAIQ
jgi:hypothetical protein